MKKIYALMATLMVSGLTACQTPSGKADQTEFSYPGEISPLSQLIRIEFKEIPESDLSIRSRFIAKTGSSQLSDEERYYHAKVSSEQEDGNVRIETKISSGSFNGKPFSYDLNINELVSSNGEVMKVNYSGADAETDQVDNTRRLVLFQPRRDQSNPETPADLYPFPVSGFSPTFHKQVSRTLIGKELTGMLSLAGEVLFDGRKALLFKISGNSDSHSIQGYQILDMENGHILKSREYLRYKGGILNVDVTSTEEFTLTIK
ncbi:hypothetical protein [Aestuariispira insulae]|uniref:Lipoprotein n=1 Tax=Aestuariispira insulae TaxID=1461337 RepID=A0A3D9HPX6_9PROT|nr:hypothetical protein [Aestuariispira insulae]RED51361.1 hypothetical protein DFP90_103161 [Aestuariispira insulae]